MSDPRPGDLFQQNRMRRQHSSPRAPRQSYYGSNHSHTEEGHGSGGGGRYRDSPSQNRRGSSSYRRQNSRHNLHNLPLEQGKIRSLLANFGFVYCADRPSDLFFHYSELDGCHSDDLNCGDEVQFYVGASSRNSSHGNGDSDQEKMAAYSLSVLEPGTVEWETEQEPVGVRRQGKVERMIRFNTRDKDGGNGGEGTLRLIPLEEDDKAEMEHVDNADTDDNNTDVNIAVDTKNTSRDGKGSSKKGTLVRYSSTDYSGSQSKSRSNNLERNDLVEFTLVTEKRSGLKYARNISIVQSERERLEELREIKLLENASREQGVVASLKNGFGFLKSNGRRDEIYFHFSHILLPEEGEGEHNLKEGQDMEFLVVTEGNGGGGGKKKLSARQVKFLPKGSVIFEQILATGVSGTLSMLPKFKSHSSNRRNAHIDDEKAGTIKLNTSVEFVPPVGNVENVPSIEISEVSLYPDDCRGLLKDEQKPELWFRVGDTILFDIVRDFVDNVCKAIPTKCCLPGAPETTDGNARIRLLQPCLAGRAQGTVMSIKDNFGFVQLAHRNIDVYFRLNEVFPPSIQHNLPTAADSGISIGSEVSFDLSLLPPKGGRSNSGRNGGRYGKRGGEKEQMRAQRVAILPTGSLKLTRIEEQVTGVITRVDKYNSYGGQIRLDKKIKTMSISERYPLVTKMLDTFLADGNERSLYFQDVQSEIENDVIISAVSDRDNLELSFVPVSDFGESHRGRICIIKVDNEQGTNNELDSKQQEKDSISNDVNVIDGEVADLIGGVSDDHPETDIEPEGINVGDAQSPETDVKADVTSSMSNPRKKSRSRTIKSTNFDRQSLSQDLVNNPPMNGDKVSMTIIYSRCTDSFTVLNMSLVERSNGAINYNMCEGYVILEPVHTSFKESKSKRRGFEGGGWGSDTKESESDKSNGDGLILLVVDPTGLYKPSPASEMGKVKSNDVNDCDKLPISSSVSEAAPQDEVTTLLNQSTDKIATLHIEEKCFGGKHISFNVTNGGSGGRNFSERAKRGDYVTFMMGKGGKAKDIHIKGKGAAIKTTGTLSNLNKENGTASFLSSIDNKEYEVLLSEVISCDVSVLKGGEAAEGILYNGNIIGICRSADLYLASSTCTSGVKKRPKLNLTVKKELRGLGGKIIAQSGMAKGPDGTNGFASGWTTRVSKYSPQEDVEDGAGTDVAEASNTETDPREEVKTSPDDEVISQGDASDKNVAKAEEDCSADVNEENE